MGGFEKECWWSKLPELAPEMACNICNNDNEGLRGKPGNCAGGLEGDLCTRCHGGRCFDGLSFGCFQK